jgi:tetratricopeptide (TPR) repeat protein
MSIGNEDTQTADKLVTAARTAFETGDFATGENHLLKAIGVSPTRASPRLLLADHYVEAGHFDKARTLLAPVAESTDDPGKRLEARAMIRLMDRDVDGALDLFRRALSATPSSLRALEGIRRILEKSGKVNAARGALRRVLVLAPRHPDGLAALQWAAIQATNWADAVRAGRKLLIGTPSRPRDQALLGWASFKSGSGGQAVEMFNRALILAPTDGWTQYTAASIFFSAGLFQRAEAACEAALAANFSPAESSFLLARTLRAQDRLAESERAASSAISRRPELITRWEIVQHTMKMDDFRANASTAT